MCYPLLQLRVIRPLNKSTIGTATRILNTRHFRTDQDAAAVLEPVMEPVKEAVLERVLAAEADLVMEADLVLGMGTVTDVAVAELLRPWLA